MAPAEGRGPALADRVRAARARLAQVAATGQGEYGAPDPKTGERWHRGNVLGHMAEFLDFWGDQLRAALAGAEAVGRGEPGYAARKAGIDRGAVVAEATLRAEVARGLESLEVLLRGLSDVDLAREIEYRPREGSPQGQPIAEFADDLLVGHVEGHLEQLESLT